MIDTVILRIHDIKKNAQLVKCLDLYNPDGYNTQTARIPKEELAEIRKQGVKNDSEFIDILQQKRSGEFLIKTQVGKQMNASNHYSFTYFINYTKDHIEFNFSVPKYMYGTNILLFTEHFLDRDYKFHNATTLEYSFNRSFKLLNIFFKTFLHNEFIFCKLDLKDIEVNRIDVCFNQVFRSKADALLYLDYQKRLKKKYARDEDGVMRDYTTSLMYTTKRYSAKIYHKGAEYEKNDLKEHLKINKERGKEYFKTKELQAFGDKILRYEITIRNAYLNYMHKNFIFRQDCKSWQKMHLIYTKIDNAIQKNDRISKKIGKLPAAEKMKYMFEHPYEKITKDDRYIYKQVSKVITRRRYFMLDIDYKSLLFNSESVPYNDDFVPFTGRLLSLCFDKLFEFMDEFQIKELPDEEIIKRLIDDYNSKHRVKLPKSEMVQFYANLIKYGSFKDAIKYAGYSRATVYRYLQRFKLIGVTDKSIKPIDNSNAIPHAPLDLRDYHVAITYNNSILKHTHNV